MHVWFVLREKILWEAALIHPGHIIYPLKELLAACYCQGRFNNMPEDVCYFWFAYFSYSPSLLSRVFNLQKIAGTSDFSSFDFPCLLFPAPTICLQSLLQAYSQKVREMEKNGLKELKKSFFMPMIYYKKNCTHFPSALWGNAGSLNQYWVNVQIIPHTKPASSNPQMALVGRVRIWKWKREGEHKRTISLSLCPSPLELRAGIIGLCCHFTWRHECWLELFWVCSM